MLRVGTPHAGGQLLGWMAQQGWPLLLSAAALWDGRRERFRPAPAHLAELDVALDSAGYLADARGGYPWSLPAYVRLGQGPFRWFAQPDHSCRPADVAAHRRGRRGRAPEPLPRDEVRRRIARSAELLARCVELSEGDPRLLPILQGARAGDYLDSAARVEDVLDGRWPLLVGIGAVFGRPLRGPDGLAAVLASLRRTLPETCRFHLFGVKGQAWAGLARDYPELAAAAASRDSQSWGLIARRRAWREGRPCTFDDKREALTTWVEHQARALPPRGPQLRLPLVEP